MKRIHPNASHAAVLAALAVSLGAMGCQSNSGGGGIANPFLAPDRVPPPATRAILPGQAQPYYPGDPLPVMQSSTQPAVDANGLAWSPADGNSTAATENRTVSNPTAPPTAVVATEAAVAVPADSDELRFALPRAAEPAPIAPIAPTPIELAAPAPDQGVVQASYTEPDFGNVAPELISPWQPPRIDRPMLPPPVAPFAMAQTPAAQPSVPMQNAAPTNTMDVRLRAVPSPPPDPLPDSTPRIRLPGEAIPQTASHDGFRPRGSMR